jgi:hypothetical protein
MSTTEGRRERMQRVLKCLHEAKKPLTPNEIAQRTEILTEVTMDRFFKYLAELEWSGILNKQGNRYSLVSDYPMKLEREFYRERVKKKKVKGVV